MEDKNLKVSIVMTSYNYEHFIKEAIESIINQTYSHWELIIIDDGSEDNSVEVIKKYCELDSRIKFFEHENRINKGLKDSLLLGLEKASFEWISFLESDDIFRPNHLEEKIKIINSDKTTDFIFNDIEFFGEEEGIKGYDLYLEKRTKLLSNNRIKYADLLEANFIPTFSCVMVKKDVLKSCDFNSPVPQSLDWILWTQLITKTKMTYVQKKLTKWRKHLENYSNSVIPNQRVKVFSKILKHLDEDKHNNFWIELYAFINKTTIEKLLRPQVGFASRLILNKLFKNKFVELVKV